MGFNYQRSLASSVGEYVAADVSQTALQDARTKGFLALPISKDGIIEAGAGSFDGATCVEVFEHLFDPLAAAREIHRVLQPGGVLVATVPNFGYHAWRLMAFLRARVPAEPEDPRRNRFNGVHIRFFSKGTFRNLLRDAGFRHVRIMAFEDSCLWDFLLGLSYLAYGAVFLRKYLPVWLHFRFLEDVWPTVFAIRLRAVAVK
jgi:SAM-dependent methyltransferase